MKLIDFSELVQGTILGNPDIEITGVAGIKDAGEGDITFISSSKYIHYLDNSRVSCVIVKEPVNGLAITQLIVSNPYYAFAKALEQFHPYPAFKPGVNELAAVSDTAIIGRNVSVYPFAHISENTSVGDNTAILTGVFIGENTKIGSQCIIYPNVVIRENVQIGNRVIIHSGTVIGSDGYGYTFEKGVHYKIPQVGGVIIEDDVEIGSNVSVDRATLGNTIIGKGTKIDNLAQIAHNVKIGEGSLIVAQVVIGGSSEIGSFVTIGGQAAIADHTIIESGTMIVGQSGVFGNVKKGVYAGTLALPHRDWLRSNALFAKLPEMNRRIKELEEQLNALKKEDTQ